MYLQLGSWDAYSVEALKADLDDSQTMFGIFLRAQQI